MPAAHITRPHNAHIRATGEHLQALLDAMSTSPYRGRAYALQCERVLQRCKSALTEDHTKRILQHIYAQDALR